MEHIDRDDEIDSFDSYLGGKVDKIAPPATIEKETECQTDASAVASGSIEQSNLDASVNSADLSVVPDVSVGEKTAVLELKTHPVNGTYLVEISVTAPIDDEWKQVFIESYNLAGGLEPEKMIDIIHRNEMAIIKIKTQNQGIRKRLEGALKDINESRRNDILEKDKKFRIKKTSESPASNGPAAKKSQAGKSAGMKVADTLQSLMMTKEAIVAKLKDRKLYGVVEENYVEKLFASK